MGELRLEVTEFASLTRWRWVLTGHDGTFVADFEVRLDSQCWQYEAFSGLQWYLDKVATREREAGIVAEVGEWIGQDVFGPIAGAIARERPITVRVIVPIEARSLLLRPLELGHVGGIPLSLQDVTLVMQIERSDGKRLNPVGERLRVLGLFSMLQGEQPLNLRRERQALVRLLTGIAATGRAAEVRVLQYGVTRERLREVLEEDEGWDVIHVSGHGAPGELLLEQDDGSPEPVTAGELAGMLDLSRERVKLVVLSACWSAAMTSEEQRRLLDLPLQDPTAEVTAKTHDPLASGLAAELTERLGCAVLAMRFPVTDDFAIALSAKLYDLLAQKGRPLPRALSLALRQVTAVPPTAACPALSAGTPALFGAEAVGLRLEAPRRFGPESYDTRALKMAGFPPQPVRFVGRTRVMARASAVLAAASGIAGVLLHGMPGGGKTACALELAYTHEDAFDRMVWYKAPDEDQDITGALTDFALTLERELPGFQMAHVVADMAMLTGFLPKLAELIERRRVLIVIDNIESLLSGSGQWRDARWAQVTAALCGHAGLGRVILTGRRAPAGLASAASIGTLHVAAVDALSLDEALLLARELPHLRGLVQGELGGIDRETARGLALGVLNIAQGHPKLLELAEGQATDPVRLAALVQVGDQAWRESGGLPEGFFRIGEPQAHPDDYLHVLAAWTSAVADGLTDAERCLFLFLCCLEEGDRILPAVDSNWSDLWNRLKLTGQPPGINEALTALATNGLIAIQPATDRTFESYGIHPAVAAAGRASTGKHFQEAVDTELAAYWNKAADWALEREGLDRSTGLVIHAGLAVLPYLMRQGDWNSAATRLLEAFDRNPSRANAAALLPAARKIAAKGDDLRNVYTLAKVLEPIDPAAAEQQTRIAFNAAIDRGEYVLASVTNLHLITCAYNNGRLIEALALVDSQLEYSRRAGLGPWTQALGESWRLRVLNAMGRHEHVLTEVQRLLAYLHTLSNNQTTTTEVAYPFDVREAVSNIGYVAAAQLGLWEDALALNAAGTASLRDRGSSAFERARGMLSDTGP